MPSLETKLSFACSGVTGSGHLGDSRISINRSTEGSTLDPYQVLFPSYGDDRELGQGFSKNWFASHTSSLYMFCSEFDCGVQQDHADLCVVHSSSWLSYVVDTPSPF